MQIVIQVGAKQLDCSKQLQKGVKARRLAHKARCQVSKRLKGGSGMGNSKFFGDSEKPLLNGSEITFSW